VFYFEATGATADDVALALSDFFNVSVLVHGDMGKKSVNGRLKAATLDEGIDSLCFLIGTKYRKLGDDIYFVGGSSSKVIKQFAGNGLKPGELGGLREGVSLVADRIVVETDQVRASQIQEVVEGLTNRRSLTLEIYAIDVSELDVNRVNAWLQAVRLGGSYFANTAIPYVGMAEAASGAANAVVNPDAYKARGFNGLADVQVLFDFMRDLVSSRLILREQIQVLSGGRSRFQSGQVVEDVTYTTAGQTSGQLVSGISRRTVGLTVEVGASCMGSTNWFVEIRLADSAIAGDEEFTTDYEGERIISEGESFFLLAAFTRNTQQSTRDGIPVLSSIPGIGKVFRKGETLKRKRHVMVLARPVQMGVPSEMPDKFDDVDPKHKRS